MSLWLFLTNCLFCGAAALFLIPLLRRPNMLIYYKGIPVFAGLTAVLLKLLVPCEFSFTQTLASRNIMPAIRRIWIRDLFNDATIGDILLSVWLLVAVLLFMIPAIKYWKLMKILSVVPETKNEEILKLLSGLCVRKQIRKAPKVIQLDLQTGPFLAGLRKPVIVLPHCQMSGDEVEFILGHELEHLANRHMLIKICTEIVTAVYWWNPVVWLLRREALRAMEMQADINVMKELPNKVKLSYVEALVAITKKTQHKQRRCAPSFALHFSMLKYRLHTALKFDCFKKNREVKAVQVLPLALSAIIVLASFLFTFASYSIGPQDEDAFTINPRSDYLVAREDGLYDLYVEGKFYVTLKKIPKDFSEMPVHK